MANKSKPSHDAQFEAFRAKLLKEGDDFGSYEMGRELEKFEKVRHKLSTANKRRLTSYSKNF